MGNNYETKTVLELRAEARTRPALQGSWIATATKTALIDALNNNDLGELFTPPAPRPASPLPSTITPPPASDPSSPEQRILDALRELKSQQQTVTAPSEELDALKDRVEALAEETGNATVAVHNIAKDVQRHVENIESSLQFHSDTLDSIIKELAARAPRDITVTLPDLTRRNVGVQHKSFDDLLKLIACRVNVFMVGPAGSGKTCAAEAVAKALGLAFYSCSVGPQSTQSQIFGYMDANGRLVRSLFREAYENGGVFLMDEIDAGNAAVITAINQATANEYCGFPDGMVKKHADFVFLAAGNTFGRGADRQYVGRTQLDAATLDRFAVLAWEYDEALENAITSNAAWTQRVQTLRANAERNKVRHVISPRASIAGAKLLAAGMDQAQVEELLLWKGIDKATREKMEANV